MNHQDRSAPAAVGRPGRVAGGVRGTRGAVAMAVVGVLSVMAACGQKGGNDTTPVQQQSTTTGSAASPGSSATSARSASTLSPATTGSPRTTGTTDTSSRSSSSVTTVVPKPSDPQYTDFCGEFAKFLNDINALPITPDNMSEYYKTAGERIQSLTDVAPAELKADMETVNNAYKKGVMDDSDPAVKSATDRINAWMVTNCGFSPD